MPRKRLMVAIAALVVVVALVAVPNHETSVKADSASSHFVLVQGVYLVPGQPQVSTVFRIDTQSGESWYAAYVSYPAQPNAQPPRPATSGLQWFPIVSPRN